MVLSVVATVALRVVEKGALGSPVFVVSERGIEYALSPAPFLAFTWYV